MSAPARRVRDRTTTRAQNLAQSPTETKPIPSIDFDLNQDSVDDERVAPFWKSFVVSSKILNKHSLLERVANSLIVLLTKQKRPRNAKELAKIARMSERVIRILGENASQLTLQGTNTYLVGTGSSRFLIDCSDGRKREYEKNLKKAMRDNKVDRIEAILITHWHPDHCFGIESVRKCLNDYTIQAYKMVRARKGELAVRKQKFQKQKHRHYVDIKDGDVFKCEGATLVAMHTPGHAEDHMCFRLENEGAIFAGDCIMNGSTAEFEDLSAYSMSLDRLLEAFSSANKKNKNYDNYDDYDDRPIDDRAKCYPSHGDVISDGERMTEGYLKHRTSRERQFLKELKTFGEKGANVWELAMKVYGKLVGALVFIMSCLKITKQHLEKMRQDGSVTVLQKQKFGISMILSYALAILSLGLLGSTNSTRYVVVMNANKNE